MIEYKFYFGRKFYQRQDGYWICTADPKLPAHRWVWMQCYGSVPVGMDIHHLDENKSNNIINNLQIVTRSEHLKIHWRKRRFNPNQLLLPI